MRGREKKKNLEYDVKVNYCVGEGRQKGGRYAPQRAGVTVVSGRGGALPANTSGSLKFLSTVYINRSILPTLVVVSTVDRSNLAQMNFWALLSFPFLGGWEGS